MTEQPDLYQRLQFQGMAKDGISLWTDPQDGQPYELHPTTVMRHNLTDRMREGIEAQDTDPAPEAPPEGQETPPEAFGEGEDDGPFSPVGGYDSEWRWDYIVVDGEVVVAMDNRPAIDAAAKAGHQVPRLEQAVIPLELIRVVALAR